MTEKFYRVRMFEPVNKYTGEKAGWMWDAQRDVIMTASGKLRHVAGKNLDYALSFCRSHGWEVEEQRGS